MAAKAFLQVLEANLNSLIQRKIGMIMGVDEEMKKLFKSLIVIKAVLADAEARQLQSKAFQNWLSKLADIAYQIDDILDECAMEVSKSEQKRSGMTSLKKILHKYKIGRRIKVAAAILDAVAVDRHVFDQETGSNQIALMRKMGSSSFLGEPDHIYGREEDKEKVLRILLDQVSEFEQLSVLPIIGLGGLGKTTLAQLVYNDKWVTRHFDIKMWICVSDHFDLRVLLKKMIESATRSKASDFDVLECRHRLREVLNQKRFLLILDDVWNEDIESWEMLRSTLACGSHGSSIVVTTRLKKVADIMGTLPAYCLNGLSDDNCWMLFRQRAFGREDGEYPDLEYIGKQIVKKCAGVPLAAKALGGLLRFKRKEIEWIYVRDSEIWNLPEETLILPALRLSYHHLPSLLKWCFVYCAIFPKDYTIEKGDLIFRWMAQGFISSNEILQVEDVGDQIWNELVLRSLFEEVKTTGRKTTCKMHDLVHDLARSIMVGMDPGAEMKGNSKIREVHMSEHYTFISSSIAAHLSTLTTITDYSSLRILKLDSNMVEELPSATGKLKHLRYIDLSHSSIHTLPHTFCSLWNLQILILDYCSHLKSLPKNIRCMTNLRHIFLEGCLELSHMPSRIGELTCLKTLSLFIVGGKIGNELDELEHLNLGGRLEIKHLERVQKPMTANKANLFEKPNLRDLVLRWEGDSTSSELVKGMANDEKVLEALKPHPNLETLEIHGFRGYYFPHWMIEMENLSKIVIEKCQSCSCLSLGDLPRLKSLYLRNLPALEYIHVNDENSVDANFPSLKDLTLYNLPNLKGLVKEEDGKLTFPNLRSLYMKGCQSLILPALSTLEELDAWDCSLLNFSSFSYKLENLTALFLGFDAESSNGCISPKDAILEGPGNLKELVIWNAGEFCLPEKWFRGLKSLQVLVIDQCKMGSCFPDAWLRHLTALEGLTLCNCSDLVGVPEEIAYLQLLESLELGCLPNMLSLTQALRHIPSLKSLSLYHLPQLTSLPDWLGDLTSLVRLNIDDCPKVASLPSSVGGMTNLGCLCISGCPQLAWRCVKDTGEDWPQIAHIPQLDILLPENYC